MPVNKAKIYEKVMDGYERRTQINMQPTLEEMQSMKMASLVAKYGEDPELFGKHLFDLSITEPSIAKSVYIKLQQTDFPRQNQNDAKVLLLQEALSIIKGIEEKD
jgi:hypothetical protein